MMIKVALSISAPRAAVWGVITDFDNVVNVISGINKVEVLERPEQGLVGLKWQETRTLFGQTATEEMWITEYAENEFYKTRAESHGAVYISTIAVVDEQNGSCLSMTFSSQPQTWVAKVLSLPMGFLCKNATKKALLQDLKDIKAAVEQPPQDSGNT